MKTMHSEVIPTALVTERGQTLSYDLESLAERRLARLAQGQLQLMIDRVATALSSPCEDALAHMAALNGAVADFKDWAEVILEARYKRIQLKNGDSICLGSSSAMELIERARDLVLQGEWTSSPTWFINEFPKYLEVINQEFAKLDSSTIYKKGDYSIGEFQLSDLTPHMREEVAKICKSRKIDTSNPKPQVGIEFSVSADDVEHMIDYDGAIVFTIHKDEKVVGIYILYLDDRMLTQGGKDNMSQYIKDNKLQAEQCAYGELVILDKAFARETFGKSSRPYHEVTHCLWETCALFGITHIVAEVREGNIAMIAHKEVGYEETGLSRIKNGFQLNFVAMKNAVLLGNRQETCLAEAHFSDSSAFIASPLSVSALEKKRGNLCSEFDSAWKFANTVLDSLHLRPSFKLTPYPRLSGDKCGILVHCNSDQLAIFQTRRAHDEWEVKLNSVTGDGPVYATFKEQLTAVLSHYYRAHYRVPGLHENRRKIIDAIAEEFEQQN